MQPMLIQWMHAGVQLHTDSTIITVFDCWSPS